MKFFKNIFKKEADANIMINIDGIGPVPYDPRYIETLCSINDRLVELKSSNQSLEIKNEALQKKLNDLEPIVEDAHYKPAKSKECYKCHYGVKLSYTYDGQAVYGCRKDMICEDFKEE